MEKNISKKLNELMKKLNNNYIDEAISELNGYVFYPNKVKQIQLNKNDNKISRIRMQFGFNFILSINESYFNLIDEREYIHLIGENSGLVTIDNIIYSELTNLKIVPKSGMRVLQDNPSICERLILEYLGR